MFLLSVHMNESDLQIALISHIGKIYLLMTYIFDPVKGGIERMTLQLLTSN